MKMGLKLYYSEISGQKEVKKRQQRIMMILDSKAIRYDAIDITEPGRENDKDFMLKNAKPKGDAKFVLSPQIFNDEEYCGDYDDFDLANENDELENFLKTPIQRNGPKAATTATNGTSGSRESSAEVENNTKQEEVPVAPVQNASVEDEGIMDEQQPSDVANENAEEEEEIE